MSVSDYLGIEGFAVDAKSAQDCYEALDRIHTQILDELGENSFILSILEDAMHELAELEGVEL